MSVKKILDRADIADSHKWDLSHLFSSDAEWEVQFKKLESDLPMYQKFRGRMHESSDIFAEALAFDTEIQRDLEKIYTYAHLRNDEDKAQQHYLGYYQRAMNLYTRASEISSYMTPEIQSIPAPVIAEFLKDTRLKEYAFVLEKILRYKPHTLSNEIEEILAMSGEMSQAASQAFSQLDNADMKFGIITDDKGESVELSHGNFSSFLMSRHRDIREKAFFQYYKSYDDHKNTIAATYAYSQKKDVYYSRVRKFKSTRASSLFPDNVPLSVYDNLILAVRKNTGPLYEYLRFRKKALGVDELHFYDTYVPIVSETKFNMPYEEAVEVCVKALAPLGEDYVTVMRKGLLGGWVDRYENRGKRSGAYSSGCYDSPPYILMNYKDDNINSLYTLMHEAGHSMHSWYSAKHQPYVNYSYTIFVAEVASTLNEVLLSAHLLDIYKDDPKMRVYILNREIDDIRATLFRQTMFAEFEMITHEIIEENKPLTLDVLRKEYKKLLEVYFGDTIVIDDELTLECLRIPHFYSPFYVYKYATGISAAIALADRVLRKVEGARESYLDFLKLGGSMFPIDELKTAGVDMGSQEPVENAIRYFGGLVTEFIEAYAKI